LAQFVGRAIDGVDDPTFRLAVIAQQLAHCFAEILERALDRSRQRVVIVPGWRRMRAIFSPAAASRLNIASARSRCCARYARPSSVMV
jgi:hypothetical protein